jgi:transaldolase
MALALRATPLAARPRQGRVATSRSLRVRPAAAYGEHDTTAHRNNLPGATQLDALRSVSKLVVDTGDIEAIAKWKPEDATTNPRCGVSRTCESASHVFTHACARSLLLKASFSERYKPLAIAALSSRAGRTVAPGGGVRGEYAGAADALAVAVGAEILNLVPGRVSTEADARLAFDTQGTVEHACVAHATTCPRPRARYSCRRIPLHVLCRLRLIGLYEEQGISRERVLIKARRGASCAAQRAHCHSETAPDA